MVDGRAPDSPVSGRRSEPVHPAELGAHDAVLYASAGWGPAWTFRRGEEATEITTTGRISVTAVEGVREAVLAGLGYAIVSEWVFTDAQSRGEVRPFVIDWALPTLDLWAVFPTRQPTEKARRFVEMLAAALS